MKSFKGILVLGEKKVFSKLTQIIGVAAEANAILKESYKSTENPSKITANMHTVRALEKKSDELAFAASEEITAGAVSPNIIDSLIEAAHLADNIVDILFYLSRELSRMAKADTKEFAVHQEAEWAEVYTHMLNLGDQALAKLKQMLSSGSMPEILQLRKEIEALEEQGDDIKDAAFDKLYAIGSRLHYLQFYHYAEMLHKTDDILDNCEDLSDAIVSIVTAILK
jgi:uncharacterized protein Yka (UPF0111/DUF47 family)